MSEFRYQAVEENGASVAGVIEAEDRKGALRLLGQRGLFPSLLIPGKKGTWHLVLNARSLHSISNARRKICTVPVTRLREGIQNDVRAWFATHAARPGYLSVR